MTTPHNDVSRTDGTSPSAGWETVYTHLDAPTTAHDDTPPEIVPDGGAPRTGTVARWLDARPTRGETA